MKAKPQLLTIEEAKARGLWFISKRYGYGWVPITWQGWLTTAGSIALIACTAFLTIEKPAPTSYDALLFFKGVISVVFVTLYICYKKGERAYWRWGK